MYQEDNNLFEAMGKWDWGNRGHHSTSTFIAMREFSLQWGYLDQQVYRAKQCFCKRRWLIILEIKKLQLCMTDKRDISLHHFVCAKWSTTQFKCKSLFLHYFSRFCTTTKIGCGPMWLRLFWISRMRSKAHLKISNVFQWFMLQLDYRPDLTEISQK